MAHRNYFQQTQKRRYRSRNYRNPHLNDRKRIAWKPVVSVLSVVIVVMGVVIGMFGHPIFRIHQVEILGVESLDKTILESVISAYLQDARLIFFSHSNRFPFSSEELSSLLTEQFALAHVSIGLQEGTMFIQLEERTSNLFWKTQGKLYVVDLDGVVVREVVDSNDTILKQKNLSELPIFVDINNILVDVGSLVLTPEEIEQAFLFLKHLQDASMGYTYIEVDRLAGKWVRLVTEQGYSILFDLTGNIDEQFQHLSTVLQGEVSEPARLEYIDLRFGDKVYFK